MRPREWVKNVFVLAALVFTKRIFDPSDLLQGGLAFVCFCLISGAAYLFNDIRDRENDRQHPLKRHRPIASGALRVSIARPRRCPPRPDRPNRGILRTSPFWHRPPHLCGTEHRLYAVPQTHRHPRCHDHRRGISSPRA